MEEQTDNLLNDLPSPKKMKDWLYHSDNPNFEREPCKSFREFIDDPYYLGIGDDTYERIKVEGEKIWQGFREGKINEGIALWGIGSGKSYLSEALACILVHWLLCLENPHKFFGLTNDKPIVVVNMGVSATQAKNVIFAGMRKFIESSEFFKEFQPEILATEIKFPKKNIALYCGNSQETMPIGMNIIFLILDEASWFLDNENKSIAEDIYNTGRNRIVSRFGDRGFMMIVSSVRYVDDFISRHYEKVRNLDYVYKSMFKTWEVKDRNKMSNETFEFVVSKDEAGNPLEIWKDIPKDYFRVANENAEKFMRDFGARGSLVMEAFDRDASIVIREANRKRQNPVDEAGRFKEWFMGDNYSHFIHIDLGLKKDACGLAMGRYAGWEMIEGERKRKVYIDLMMQIKAKPNEEISFSEVRQIIYNIKERGFRIRKITFDGWQCLDGKTKIPLLEGGIKTIDKIKKGDYVYSINNNNEIVADLVLSNARKTGKKILWKIKLDNNKIVRCSGNHPFMLRDGTYKRADELKIGDSLMPLYFKKGMRDLKNYKMVFNPRYNRFEYIHRIIARQMNILRRGKLIHHKNADKNNNEPDNLISLTFQEHGNWHRENGKKGFKIARERLKNNPEALARKNKIFLENAEKYRRTVAKEQRRNAGIKGWETKLKKGFKPYIRTEKCRNKLRESTKKQWQLKDWTERKKKISESIKNLWRNPEYRQYMGEVHKHPKNHKVVGIEKTNRFIEMYDIEIKDFHNFAISGGIFVHNSVDSIQILRSKGLIADVLSVDRDTKAYDTLKEDLHSHCLDFYPFDPFQKEYMRLELVKGKKVDHPPSGSKDICLAGDTKILLLNGKSISIKNLVGKEFEVYSCLPNGKIVIGDVFNVHSNGIKNVIRIWLDNGKYIDCTGNHLFMLRNGKFCRADKLKIGSSLMPLYKKLSIANSKTGLNGYEMVKDNKSGKWVFVHQLVAREKLNFTYRNKEENRKVIHHKDFDKKNNSSKNLEIMNWRTHRELHCENQSKLMKEYWERGYYRNRKRTKKKQEFIERDKQRFILYNKSKEKIEKMKERGLFRKNGSKVMRELWQDEGFRKRHLERVKKRNQELIEKRQHPFQIFSRDKKGRIVKLNHKVVYVEEIGKKEVFDLTVSNYGNFALEAGVFVHNCDAVAGVCFLVNTEVGEISGARVEDDKKKLDDWKNQELKNKLETGQPMTMTERMKAEREADKQLVMEAERRRFYGGY